MDSTQGHVSNAANARANAKRGKQKLVVTIVGVVIAIAVILLSGWFFYRSSTAATIDNSKYQAVFFTNGQVYFGKLKQVNSNYFKLTDVFYIQAQEAQTNDKNSENPQKTSNNSTDIRLIKLGSEVHGPDDAMIISKDQVLFFENLKKDGKVSDSITKYNAQKK